MSTLSKPPPRSDSPLGGAFGLFDDGLNPERVQVLPVQIVVHGHTMEMCELRLKIGGTHKLTFWYGEAYSSRSMYAEIKKNACTPSGIPLDFDKYDVFLRGRCLRTHCGRDVYDHLTAGIREKDFNKSVVLDVYGHDDAENPATTFKRLDMSYPTKLQVSCKEHTLSDLYDEISVAPRNDERVEFILPIATNNCIEELRKALPLMIERKLRNVDGQDRVIEIYLYSGTHRMYKRVSDPDAFFSHVLSCFAQPQPLNIAYVVKPAQAPANPRLSDEALAHKVSAVASAAAAVFEGIQPSMLNRGAPVLDAYRDVNIVVPEHLTREKPALIMEWFEDQMKQLRERWADVTPLAEQYTSRSEQETGVQPASVKASQISTHDKASSGSRMSLEQLTQRMREDNETQNSHGSLHEKPATTVHRATCNVCDEVIEDKRYKCLTCPDYDCCGKCKPDMPFLHPHHRFVTLSDADLMPEGVTPADWTYHPNIICDGCDAYIFGPRFKCVVCEDFDYCAACEAEPANDHVGTDANMPHLFVKINKPLPRHVNAQRYVLQKDTKGKAKAQTHAPSDTAASNLASTIGLSQSAEARNAAKENHVPFPSDEASLQPTFDRLTLAASQNQATANAQSSTGVRSQDSASVPGAVSTEARTFQIPSSASAKESQIRDEEPLEFYDMEYLDDFNFKDGTEIAAGAEFVKMWRVINNGQRAWPEGTSLVTVCSTSDTEEGKARVVESVLPHSIPGLISSATLRAPDRPGPWNIFFRLERPINPSDPNSGKIRFGQQLWCSLNVVADATPRSKSTKTGAQHEADAEATYHSQGSFFFETPSINTLVGQQDAATFNDGSGSEWLQSSARRLHERNNGTAASTSSPYPAGNTATMSSNGSSGRSATTDVNVDDVLEGNSAYAPTDDEDSDYELVGPSSRSASDTDF